MDKEILEQYINEIKSSYESLQQYVEEFGTDEQYTCFYTDSEEFENGLEVLTEVIDNIQTYT